MIGNQLIILNAKNVPKKGKPLGGFHLEKEEPALHTG